MNTSRIRSKRVIIPTTVAVAVLGVGGAVWASTASADDVSGGERDRVASAALEVAGGGTVTDVETGDDPGEAYEVEVRTDDGQELDVTLDQDLEVVAQESDDDSDGRDDRTGEDGRDDEGRALTDAERSSAEEAALEAVGGGTVTDVEASDDASQAYEVDVVAEDGTEWDVDLDASFARGLALILR